MGVTPCRTLFSCRRSQLVRPTPHARRRRGASDRMCMAVKYKASRDLVIGCSLDASAWPTGSQSYCRYQMYLLVPLVVRRKSHSGRISGHPPEVYVHGWCLWCKYKYPSMICYTAVGDELGKMTCYGHLVKPSDGCS